MALLGVLRYLRVKTGGKCRRKSGRSWSKSWTLYSLASCRLFDHSQNRTSLTVLRKGMHDMIERDIFRKLVYSGKQASGRQRSRTRIDFLEVHGEYIR